MGFRLGAADVLQNMLTAPAVGLDLLETFAQGLDHREGHGHLQSRGGIPSRSGVTSGWRAS